MLNKLKITKILELNESYQKVIFYFFSFPNKEVNLSELATSLKMSKKTASKIINRLVKEGFLIKKIYGKVWRIYCNTKHKYNYTRKIGFNLTMIYETEILEDIKKTIKNYKSIILFGSYRKGDDNEKSDVDIAIEVLDNKPIKIIELGILPEFGFRKDVPVNLHIFSKNKTDINLFSNIANGIILDGFLEVK